MASALTKFASCAAQKLRLQKSSAGTLVVFIHTSAFRAQDLLYSASITVPLRRPTGDSTLLVPAALAGLRQIYRKG
jgi:DNA polymerase V